MIAKALQYMATVGRKEAVPVMIGGVPHKVDQVGEYTPIDNPEAFPATISVNSLAGFAAAIHIVKAPELILVTARKVVALGASGKFTGRRPALIVAEPAALFDDRSLNTYLAQDMMVLFLLRSFAADVDREDLLAMVGGLRASTVQTATDDAITQVVSIRDEIGSTSKQAVKNPISLRPLMTFSEIVPVTEHYVVRLTAGTKGAPPSVGLFTIGGRDRWMVETSQSIADYLRPLTPVEVIV